MNGSRSHQTRIDLIGFEDRSLLELPPKSSILSRALSYKMLMLLPFLTKILETQQFLMCMVMIRASLCRKCTTQASASENEVGLLMNGGRSVSIIG